MFTKLGKFERIKSRLKSKVYRHDLNNEKWLCHYNEDWITKRY